MPAAGWGGPPERPSRDTRTAADGGQKTTARSSGRTKPLLKTLALVAVFVLGLMLAGAVPGAGALALTSSETTSTDTTST
jgi:hypothetical protein